MNRNFYERERERERVYPVEFAERSGASIPQGRTKKLLKIRGFTLIELLVVISIIGFLATASMVLLNSARIKARDARRMSDINQLQKAIELYYNNNNAYPDNATSYPDWPTGFKAQLSLYLNKPPVDPKDDGWRYYGAYRMSWAPDANCNGNYVLWAYLEIAPDPKYTCGFGGVHFFRVLDKY